MKVPVLVTTALAAAVVGCGGGGSLSADSSCANWMEADNAEQTRYSTVSIGKTFDPSDSSDGVAEDAPAMARANFEERCGGAKQRGKADYLTLGDAMETAKVFDTSEVCAETPEFC